MAATFTLTGNVFDQLGQDVTDAYATLSANLDARAALLDSTNQRVLLPTGRIPVAQDGSWSVELVSTAATDLNIEPNTLQYRITYEATPAGARRKTMWDTGFFGLTANRDITDPALSLDVPGVTPAWKSGFTAEMDALKAATESTVAAGVAAVEADRAYVEGIVITDLGTTDGQTKALIESPSSETAQALSTAIGAEVDPIKPDGGARAVGKGELVINVKDYGAVGSGHGSTDDTTAIQAALDAAYALTGIDLGNSLDAIRGATVYFPPGAYRTTAPLEYRPYVSLRGAGTQTSRLFNDTSDLFAWTEVGGLVFEAHTSSIWLSTGVTGGHIFNLSGTGSGGLGRTSFTDVKMTVGNSASSLWKHRGRAQLIDVKYDRCVFYTSGARTVPGFDISVGGNDANSVRWLNSWCHGRGGGTAPFFRIESTGAWNYNLTFRDLVGEQNGGGFIHLHAVDGVVIENCPDWDLTAAYADDVFKVFPVSTRAPKNVRIENSFRVANAGGLAPGKYDINAASALNQNVRIVGCTPPGLSPTIDLAGDARVDGKTTGFKIVTGTYTLLATDPDEIVCNSATPITLTLPAAIGSTFGRQFRVKNVGAGTVTIGGTVDGVASPTLARWAKATYRTDGANANFGRIWFTA